MTNLYIIWDNINDKVFRNKYIGSYDTFSKAKQNTQTYIRRKNRNLPKDRRLKFEDFTIIECQLVPKEVYKV